MHNTKIPENTDSCVAGFVFMVFSRQPKSNMGWGELFAARCWKVLCSASSAQSAPQARHKKQTQTVRRHAFLSGSVALAKAGREHRLTYEAKLLMFSTNADQRTPKAHVALADLLERLAN